jgi:hypothetical protein
MIWQITVFGEDPALGTLAGAALVIAGTAVVSATAARPGRTAHTTTSPPR